MQAGGEERGDYVPTYVVWNVECGDSENGGNERGFCVYNRKYREAGKAPKRAETWRLTVLPQSTWSICSIATYTLCNVAV
mmetsp:Transcript_40364/g.87158  ORF Transcript_40364/g.87158 Transcript_40364/m.87158 type:complete len:80 (+) Transcript_40364:649-888(+)